MPTATIAVSDRSADSADEIQGLGSNQNYSRIILDGQGKDVNRCRWN